MFKFPQINIAQTGGENMIKSLLALMLAATLITLGASPVFVVALPADEACARAIPRAANVGVTLPFNLCINLP